MENLITIITIVLIMLGFMWMAGKCYETDLKDLKKTDPEFYKWLKNNDNN